jgi:hypothetical protein
MAWPATFVEVERPSRGKLEPSLCDRFVKTPRPVAQVSRHPAFGAGIPATPIGRYARLILLAVVAQSGRIRRIMIIAVARKLAIALWRFLEQGLVPQGAMLANR